MRTDVKVGSVIAIVLVLVGVWFFVVRDRGREKRGPEPSAPVAAGDQRTGQEPNVPMTTAPPVRPAYVEPEQPQTPTERESATTLPSGSSERVRVGYLPERPGESEADTTVALRPQEPSAERPLDWWQTGRNVPSRVGPTPTPPEPTLQPTVAVRPPAAAGTYRVKEGDSYWSIAKQQYGDGSLYTLLEKANPNVPASALKPDMTILLPPKPESSPRQEPSAPALTPGTIHLDVAGEDRYYVVRKGDSGFWGISIAVFQTPRYWKQIADLNPGVDPSALKPGQKVRVPKQPAEAALAAEPARRSEEPLTPLSARSSGSGVAGTGAPRKLTLPDGRVFD